MFIESTNAFRGQGFFKDESVAKEPTGAVVCANNEFVVGVVGDDVSRGLKLPIPKQVKHAVARVNKHEVVPSLQEDVRDVFNEFFLFIFQLEANAVFHSIVADHQFITEQQQGNVFSCCGTVPWGDGVKVDPARKGVGVVQSMFRQLSLCDGGEGHGLIDEELSTVPFLHDTTNVKVDSRQPKHNPQRSGTRNNESDDKLNEHPAIVQEHFNGIFEKGANACWPSALLSPFKRWSSLPDGDRVVHGEGWEGDGSKQVPHFGQHFSQHTKQVEEGSVQSN